MATKEPKEGVEPPAELLRSASSYGMEVDTEHKAKSIKLFSLGQPHMMAFHISWVMFFMSFFATFAPAAMVGPIRENLNLTRDQLGNAGVASVCAAIFSRILLGSVMDLRGPRITGALIMLLVAPAVYCIALITNYAGFVVVRFIIGISLAMFVVCSFWVGSMFNVKIVGFANAITAGWGNMGGGACHLVMPLLYAGIKKSAPGFEAWRWSFFVPAGLFTLSGMVCLIWGRDSPSGDDFRTLMKRGEIKKKGAAWPSIKVAITNYRSWILALTYGYCLGVELTVDNMLTGYVYDNFKVSYSVAGMLASIFGLMNIVTRASGGLLSDWSAKYWGMKGRLWCLWIIQTLGGVFCLAMGYCINSLSATLVTMIIFSIFCQQACGAHYGIVPFLSRRSYGTVAGIVGAGGNIGAAVTQALFFTAKADWQYSLKANEGLIYIGIMIMVLTLPLFFIHFPMWGGMVTKADPNASEEDYYLKEWSAEEVAAGLHHASMRFAIESRSQRGNKGAKALEEVLASKDGSLDKTSAATTESGVSVPPPPAVTVGTRV